MPTTTVQSTGSDISWLSPRPWHGMSFPVWTRLLEENQYDIHPTRLPMAAAITVSSACNSYSRWLGESTYGRRADRTPIRSHPLFVLGHWRTGTTMLHELLIRDQYLTYPTTFQCMLPHHFLRTQGILPHVSRYFLPRRRVMDNMEFGWDRPQEDEFALANLGVLSPYLYWAFPASRAKYDRYLTLEDLTSAEKDHWKETFLWFIRRLTLHDPRRLVLKSPPHTARLDTLLELFPQAKFIHLTRDPRTVIPSTVRTWQRMHESCALQFSTDDLQAYVLDTFGRMYDSYDRHRVQIDSSQLYELRYEDLIERPLEELENIYRQLELPGIHLVRGRFKRYLRQVKGYRTNRFTLTPDQEELISSHCGDYMERFGYESAPVGAESG